MLGNVQYERRLTHRRTRGNQNQVRRLQTRGTIIQIDEACRNTGYVTVTLCRVLDFFKRIHNNLTNRHIVAVTTTGLNQIKNLFLCHVHNNINSILRFITIVLNRLNGFD